MPRTVCTISGLAGSLSILRLSLLTCTSTVRSLTASPLPASAWRGTVSPTLVANILKRTQPPRAAALSSVRFGPFVFHMASGELRRGEEAIRLTERECEMLRVLATSVGETVPRQALAGNGDAVSERTVDVQVNRLRRKIENDPANPLIVQTVRGVGYRLVPVA